MTDEPTYLPSDVTGLPEGAQLNPLQQMLVPYLTSNENIIVSAPTGTGKSVLPVMLGHQVLQKPTGKIIYVGIMRALAAEKNVDWSQPHHPWSKVPRALLTGDVLKTEVFESGLAEARVICATPESLLSRLLQPKKNPWLKDVELICWDEAHYLNSEGRGAAYEMTVMEAAMHLGDQVRHLMLSGTISNPEDFRTWLSGLSSRPAELIQTQWRPVPIEHHHLQYRQVFRDRIWESDRLDMIAELFQRHRGDMFLVVVFSKEFGKKVVERLRYEGFNVATHNADLTLEERATVEMQFRQRLLDGLVCTTTLTTGVNLPARHVIISSVVQGLDTDIPTYDLLQAAGRAGRVGYDEKGDVWWLLPDTNPHYHISRLKHPEPIGSNFTEEGSLELPLLASISTRRITTDKEIAPWYERTFCSVQEPATSAVPALQRGVQKLTDAGAITASSKRKDAILDLSPLGKIAVSFQIPPRTLLEWIIAVEKAMQDPGLDASDVSRLAAQLGKITAFRTSSPSAYDMQNRNDWISSSALQAAQAVRAGDAYWKSISAIYYMLQPTWRPKGGQIPYAIYQSYHKVREAIPRIFCALAQAQRKAGRLQNVPPEDLLQLAYWMLLMDRDDAKQVAQSTTSEAMLQGLANRSWTTVLRRATYRPSLRGEAHD